MRCVVAADHSEAPFEQARNTFVTPLLAARSPLLCAACQVRQFNALPNTDRKLYLGGKNGASLQPADWINMFFLLQLWIFMFVRRVCYVFAVFYVCGWAGPQGVPASSQVINCVVSAISAMGLFSLELRSSFLYKTLLFLVFSLNFIRKGSVFRGGQLTSIMAPTLTLRRFETATRIHSTFRKVSRAHF